MRIAKLTLTNFQCFGPDPTEVPLNGVTALIGSNGAGKTALLQALLRLFGRTAAEREVRVSDFHVPAGETEPAQSRSLRIEAVLDVPELPGNEDDVTGQGHDASVAAFFDQFVVDDDASPPYCRIRLDATWIQSSLPEGDIEVKLHWVRVPLDEEVEDDVLTEVRAHDRSQVQVHYVPAVREPLRQLRTDSAAMFGQLLRAVKWRAQSTQEVEVAIANLQELFANEPGIQLIHKHLNESWKVVHHAAAQSDVSIRPVGKLLQDLYRQVEAVFRPSPTNDDMPIERLSEGQRSLFYLALVAAYYRLLNAVAEGMDGADSLDISRVRPPCLTLFAIEEPENHVSPHYLARIMDLADQLANEDYGQVVLTSHSPSILRRVDPRSIRYLRSDNDTRTSSVRSIRLPPDDDEAAKYVREAVQAYPELYFSRLVILGEGDSEEIVLPALANALDVPLDRAFVSMVPLGGRHVNHFWRLLNDLDIPHVTLLDLDAGRHGGGWGRIHYAITQLAALGHELADIIQLDDDNVLTQEDLDDVPNQSLTSDEDFEQLQLWASDLENHNVFFSSPLDLDMSMLQALPKAYCRLSDGERGPKDGTPKDEETVKAAVTAVLGDADDAGAIYTDKQKALFIWYKYLFLGRGKPATHLRALSRRSRQKLAERCPAELRRLIDQVKSLLGEDADEVNANDEEE